jgi:hypothetical protein
MNIRFESDLENKYQGRIAKKHMVKSGFIDPGGKP